MLVVDASVAVKWFYPEEGSEKAQQLLTFRKKLIAPELIRVEVAAALTRLFRMQSLNLETVKALINDWQQSLINEMVTLEPTLLDFEAAVEISLSIGHQLQDCLYVAVAERLRAPLVTADNKLLKKAESVNCELLPLNPNGTINKG